MVNLFHGLLVLEHSFQAGAQHFWLLVPPILVIGFALAAYLVRYDSFISDGNPKFGTANQNGTIRLSSKIGEESRGGGKGGRGEEEGGGAQLVENRW